MNRRLADVIEVQLQSRQAYWNIKGPAFLSLRELFEQMTQDAQRDANRLAERIVALGGVAEGTAQTVAQRSVLAAHGSWSMDPRDALGTALAAFARHMRYASAQATELSDAETAALFLGIARRIDTWLWFVRTSQQAGN